jgi:diguanylate cyclase (GGDEF)-like protein
MADLLLYTQEARWARELADALAEAGFDAVVRDTGHGLDDVPVGEFTTVLVDAEPAIVDRIAEALETVPQSRCPRVGVIGDWQSGMPLFVVEAVPTDQPIPKIVGAVARFVGASEMHRGAVRASEMRIDELTRQVKRYAALQAVTARMSSTLVLSQSLSTFVDGVRDGLGLVAVATMLRDDSSEELKVIAESPEGAEEEGLLDAAMGCLQRATQSALAPPPFSCIWPKDGVVAVPVLADRRSVGAIVAVTEPGEKNEDLPPDELVALMGGLASHVGNAVRNAHLYSDVQTKSAQMSVLYEVGRTISSVHELQTLLDMICDHAMTVTGARRCSLMLLDEQEEVLRIRAARGIPEWIQNSVVAKVGEGVAGHVIEFGEPLLVTDIQEDPRFDSKVDSRYYGSKSLLCVPLVLHGVHRGVLCLTEKAAGGPFDQADLELAVLLGSHASVAIDNAYLYGHLRTLASTDSLTRLYNHRHMMDHLEGAIKHARRHGAPLSVIMLDLDHFKQVNDTYGHQQGDRVLQAFASVLERTAREEDILARYGGEEFAAILPGTGLKGALRLGERIAERVRKLEFARGADILRITVSIGVAELTADVQAAADLTDRADRALYQAKRTGRDRVCAFDADLADGGESWTQQTQPAAAESASTDEDEG